MNDNYTTQMRHLTGGQRRLIRKELKVLPTLLQDGEVVELISNGLYERKNGAVVATSKRVMFLDKSMFGLTHEDFPYSRISSVKHETGMMLGELRIHASGNDARIKSMGKEAAREIANLIRMRMNFPHEDAAPAAGESTASQLKTLAELHATGALTDDEFASQKAKLLG